MLALSLRIEEAFNFLYECVDISELSVDRSETNICDLVDVFELFHDKFTDEFTVDFLLHRIVETAFNVINDLFHLSDGNRALLTCADDTIEQFIAVESLAAAILLDDHQDHFLYFLIGGESSSAFLMARPSSV